MPYEAKMARMVLDDCRYALDELRKDPQGQAWFIRWFGILALLKTVDYVLETVDAQACPEIREARQYWRKKLKKPDPPIYWEFILKDRDRIVHHYKLRAGQGVILRPGTVTYDLRTGQEVSCTPGGSTTYTYPIHGGPFAGQDQRCVVEKAIAWWEQQLTEIETDAASRAVVGSSTPSPG
jgi:hypothetical protein